MQCIRCLSLCSKPSQNLGIKTTTVLLTCDSVSQQLGLGSAGTAVPIPRGTVAHLCVWSVASPTSGCRKGQKYRASHCSESSSILAGLCQLTEPRGLEVSKSSEGGRAPQTSTFKSARLAVTTLWTTAGHAAQPRVCVEGRRPSVGTEGKLPWPFL